MYLNTHLAGVHERQDEVQAAQVFPLGHDEFCISLFKRKSVLERDWKPKVLIATLIQGKISSYPSCET